MVQNNSKPAVHSKRTPEEKAFAAVHFQLKCRMFYPAILTPKFNNDKGKDEYSAVAVWPIGDKTNAKTLEAMGKHLGDAVKRFFPDIPLANLQLPVKTWGVYKKQNGKDPSAVFTDCKWINASANVDFPPSVAINQGGKLHQVVDPAEVYSGRNILIDISFWNYSNKKFGISTNLNAIVLLDGGERVASGGVDMDAAFNSFLGETAGAETASDGESLV